MTAKSVTSKVRMAEARRAGLLSLAMLAQPDPTAKFLKATSGELGPDHQLDY
jgi:hypothetical protein